MNVFYKSILVEPGKVGGVQLLPFSAFHAMCLYVLQSPFAATDGNCNTEQISLGDIITVILICSGNSKKGFKKYLRFQNSKIRRAIWALRISLYNKDKLINDIINHLNCYLAAPQVAEPIGNTAKAKAKKSGAPWPYYIVSMLWQETQGQLSELWDMSVTELACHKSIFEERNCGAEIADRLLEERERNTGVPADG